jgi:hypothetical protein
VPDIDEGVIPENALELPENELNPPTNELSPPTSELDPPTNELEQPEAVYTDEGPSPPANVIPDARSSQRGSSLRTSSRRGWAIVAE